MILAPVLVVLMFVGFQAALWNHAAAEARAVARQTALLVARDGLSSGEAIGASSAALSGTLTDVSIDVSAGSQSVVVVVRGQAPGILRGTARTISVSVTVAMEGWVPL